MFCFDYDVDFELLALFVFRRFLLLFVVVVVVVLVGLLAPEKRS